VSASDACTIIGFVTSAAMFFHVIGYVVVEETVFLFTVACHWFITLSADEFATHLETA
jgi:hypothetical protein